MRGFGFVLAILLTACGRAPPEVPAPAPSRPAPSADRAQGNPAVAAKPAVAPTPPVERTAEEQSVTDALVEILRNERPNSTLATAHRAWLLRTAGWRRDELDDLYNVTAEVDERVSGRSKSATGETVFEPPAWEPERARTARERNALLADAVDRDGPGAFLRFLRMRHRWSR